MKLPLSTENLKATALSYPELLCIIFPPQAVIHIGAGIGNGEMHLWRQWQVPAALILDADEARLDWATKAAEENPAWQIRCAVLAQTDGEVDYYHASNPAEDGLIPSEKLAVLWPNLRTSKQTRCQAQRLDNLLSEESLVALRESASVWVLINCLSALSILQGAGNELDRWSVLWLRVQLNPLIEDQTVGTLKDIEDFLEPHGYRCIYIAEGNHPAIGEAMFVRDWHAVMASRITQFSNENATITLEKLTLAERRDALEAEIATVTLARDEQAGVVVELQSRIDVLMQERDTQATLANDRQAQIEALIHANALLDQEKSMLAERRNVLEIEVATVTQARDEQAELAADRQSRIDLLTQERDSHAILANDRQVQNELLIQANITLNQEKSALNQVRNEMTNCVTQYKVEIDQLQSQLQQKEALIAKSQSDFAENDARQRLLNDEMIKAEAQIDLIKDVLLREMGFSGLGI